MKVGADRQRWVRVLVLALLIISPMAWWMYRAVLQERSNRALISAILRQDTATALSLLDHGADPNALEPSREHVWQRLLRCFGTKGNTQNTALLVLLGGHRDPITSVWHPLTESPVLVRALLDKGANIDSKSAYGETPLFMASVAGYEETVKLLLARGADVNAHGDDGVTALMLAVDEGHPDVVRALLDGKADPNVVTENGTTALMDAVWSAYENQKRDPIIRTRLQTTVKILLAYRADVHFKNANGGTALSIAKSCKEADIVALLTRAGAKE